MIALPDGLVGIGSRLAHRLTGAGGDARSTGPLARLGLTGLGDVAARLRRGRAAAPAPAPDRPGPPGAAAPAGPDTTTPATTDTTTPATADTSAAGPADQAAAGASARAEPAGVASPPAGPGSESLAAAGGPAGSPPAKGEGGGSAVQERAPAPAGAVLTARSIGVSSGGVRAVDAVDLTVGRGEVLGLIGPNGSGKSTLLNAMTGVVPAEGTLEVAGAPVPLGKPPRVRRAGLGRTYQTPQTFTALTCIENVLLGVPDRRRMGIVAGAVARPLVLADERRRWAAAQAALERVGLPDHAERPAAGLSHRDQRLLELARALVGEPKVVLLDEPSAGLNATETEEL